MKGRCLAILGIFRFGLIPYPLREATPENALRFPIDNNSSLLTISDELVYIEALAVVTE